MRTLLFTECLQHDFVGPIPAGAPLPNALHIGRAESRRLLGDPDGSWAEEGPLARFVAAWRRGATTAHHSLHIRDWHDPEDPATRGHLRHFGDHCLRGTPGAAFVAPLRPLAEAGHVVDSAILSDFAGTDLEDTLRRLAASEPARAAIIGVWTDFKVQYLAYELIARFGFEDVAVASALTASRSRSQHRQALEHMASSLDVTVIDSLPEFERWLGLEASPVVLARGKSLAELRLPEGVSLDAEERRLVLYLFRDCREVALKPLSGGFSGSRVFASESLDRGGKREVPFVVKIDTHARIAQERVAVESVENLLGAASPRLQEYVDLETRGAIKYHFATMHAGGVRTLQKAFATAATPPEVEALFAGVIERVLSRLSQAPQLDRLPLFRYYGYRPEYAASTLRRVSALAESEEGQTLRVAGLTEPLPHPRRFYERLAPGLGAEEPAEVACAWIHGDLNLANVLIDAAGNVWLIDYFWTRVGHALQDIAKLENDVKFILTPLQDDAALKRALAFERLLLSHGDLLEPVPPLTAELFADPGIAKAHAAIRTLRGFGARLLREAGFLAGPVREYRIAQLRYSAHTLSFDECDERQKRFALASTCLLGDVLP
ncbi:MAG TPA: isochorismatase family protein [Vicinamibacteria bacterium]|nr:isochorismatase family protein [Vicinamibacteria bacterium]